MKKKKLSVTLTTAAFEKPIPFTQKEIDQIKIEENKFHSPSTCEFLAYFGVALYHAQMLEESLRQLVAFSCKSKDEKWPVNLESMSMGKLFSWIKRNLPDDYKDIGIDEIEKAVQIRNFITHWVYALAFPSSGHNKTTIKIQIRCALFFREMDTLIGHMIQVKYEPNFFHMRPIFFSEKPKGATKN